MAAAVVEPRQLPLFAWGEALRADRAARVRRRRLVLRGAVLGAACAALIATIAAPVAPRLVWNASASAPLGLYRVAPGAAITRGDMVIARTPIAARALAAARHYVPANVPLVKRVAAMTGDRICALGATITVNGFDAVTRRQADRAGRPLPWWEGCVTLGPDRLLLLMSGAPDSFDGRYFGPTRRSDVIGKATALWLR
ncbi:S26 family signal peptidase [Sphingomonas sp.]|uniref:S26 family signal peptidase n=1 Tax=Sphingomonas sp. TaxID=28214 RepID=UPI002E310DF3|nr:S26 family signal peptidase [Sphingomonas sp.]HEX4693608.1 S26 family signal peptidase [Sphingomonas sp.]